MSAQSQSPLLFDGWISQAKSKNETLVRNATLVLGLVALTALCAQVSIPLPFTPVPLTLQTFAVLGGAAALGAERAVLAQTLYVGLAWLGLPILAEHKGGHEVVIGATGGYLVGFIVASYIVGRRASRGDSRNALDTAAAFIVGSLAIYVLGVSWLAHFTGWSIAEAVSKGMVPFLIGDVIKALAAGALLPSVWKFIDSKS